MPTIYLAGPEVFLPGARSILRRKTEICLRYGLEGVSPLGTDLGLDDLPPESAGHRISQANERLMARCDLLIANATPIRGVHMDVGTAYEMGFMRALGRPVLAYTNDPELLTERVARSFGRHPDVRGILRDRQGLMIEDHGFQENLMIEGAVRSSCTRFVVHPAAADQLLTDLTGFERCVEMASQVLQKYKESIPNGADG